MTCSTINKRLQLQLSESCCVEFTLHLTLKCLNSRLSFGKTLTSCSELRTLHWLWSYLLFYLLVFVFTSTFWCLSGIPSSLDLRTGRQIQHVSQGQRINNRTTHPFRKPRCMREHLRNCIHPYVYVNLALYKEIWQIFLTSLNCSVFSLKTTC